jgi:hypothetical protein
VFASRDTDTSTRGTPRIGDRISTRRRSPPYGGAIVLLGRRKDMILRRGGSIFRALVEPLVVARLAA